MTCSVFFFYIIERETLFCFFLKASPSHLSRILSLSDFAAKMFPSLALSTVPVTTTIISSTRRSQVSQLNAKKTTQESMRPTTTSTSGFSGRTTKEVTWQCVQGCGACCKLAKDFAFVTPDEIFDDPDDVEVCFVLHPPLVRPNSSVGVKSS